MSQYSRHLNIVDNCLNIVDKWVERNRGKGREMSN